MKINLLIGSLLASVAIAACGGGDTPSESGESRAATAGKKQDSTLVREVQGTPTPPRFEVPTGPPPKKVVIRDWRKGQGAQIEWGGWFTANYIAYDYGTSDRVETYWGEKPFRWFWGEDALTKGWRIGLKGMRVGGRRELIVPSKLAYGSGARAYLVELLKVD